MLHLYASPIKKYLEILDGSGPLDKNETSFHYSVLPLYVIPHPATIMLSPIHVALGCPTGPVFERPHHFQSMLVSTSGTPCSTNTIEHQ